jgi:predicted nucleic acid-binding protein
MGIVLDASATLAWLIERINPVEARLADEVLVRLENDDAVVPALWYSEVANGLVVSERRGIVDAGKSASFMAKVNRLRITEDSLRPVHTQGTVLGVARTYGLTAYDACYLELVLRTGRVLATFDGKLAQAARVAGGRVLGDPD